jgi:hypothetical protein
MVYDEPNSDITSGTFSSGEFSGTFEGTITSVVDAYGDIITNSPSWWPMTNAVTRLKITQELNLSIPFFSNIGTVTITNYHYYRASEYFPWLTYSTSATAIPLMSMNETTEQIELAYPVFLDTPEPAASGKISIYPNPASDVLSVDMDNISDLKEFSITDLHGRKIASSTSNTIEVSALSSGVYLATIRTGTGQSVKKFIKN